MPVFLDLLYREYCRARLAEMRKQLLIGPQSLSHEVSEANSDASHTDRAADRTGDVGDLQHEAGHDRSN